MIIITDTLFEARAKIERLVNFDNTDADEHNEVQRKRKNRGKSNKLADYDCSTKEVPVPALPAVELPSPPNEEMLLNANVQTSFQIISIEGKIFITIMNIPVMLYFISF